MNLLRRIRLPELSKAGHLGRWAASALLGGVLGLAAALIYWPGVIGILPEFRSFRAVRPFRSLDLWIGDHLHPWVVRKEGPAGTPKICIVGITEQCVKKYGEMPWDRRVHAELLRRLTAAGGRTVAFDIYFPHPGPGDEEFAAAMKEAGNVVLPRWAYIADNVGQTREGALQGIEQVDDAHPGREPDGVYRTRLREAAPGLYASAAAVGHINVFYDQDALARRVPAAIGERGEETFALPLGIASALVSLGRSPAEARIEAGRLVCGPIKAPLDESGCILVNYCQPVGRYVYERPAELWAADAAGFWGDGGGKAPMAFFPYSDVMEGRVPDAIFRDAVVLVGQRIRGSREDVHVTPYGSEFGVIVQAMILHTALTQRFIRPISPGWTILAMLALSLAVGAVSFSLRFQGTTLEVLGGGGLLTGLAVLGILGVVGALRRYGLAVDASPFLLVMGFNLVGGMATSASNLAREAGRRSGEMDVLLRAGRQQMSSWIEQDKRGQGRIRGADAIALSTSLSLHSPEIAAETFWQAIPCEGCVLLTVREEQPLAFDRTIVLGFTDLLDSDPMLPVARHFAREVIEAGEPVNRQSIDTLWAHARGVPNLRCFLGVPLFARGAPIAVVLLFNKRPTADSPEREFTEDHLRMVGVMRYQAAALLENARRHRMEYAMFDGFAQSLAKAVDFRDNYTHGHSRRVAEYSVGIAREMGLSEPEIEIVQRAATLHDVGKIGVSDEVLNKPGKLTDEEFAMIKAHAADGYEILCAAPSFEALLPGIRNHHERYDGRGYPDGLKGEEIPLIARIIAAADTYDAMTSDRIYRKALPVEKAMEELRRNAGAQFDPRVVEAFLFYLARKSVMGAEHVRDAQPRVLVPA